MTSKEIRGKFLEFFSTKGGSASGGKGHTIISSASLIPSETDPTVLFTTAGMHPLVPYLLGEKHPGGKRVANVQKCIRTVDIDEVGDISHLTFFEMMGNWSFGDYFKREAIEWSWEFLTSSEWMGLDKDRFAVSVFGGDKDALFDEEAFNIWREIGISEKRIAKLPKKNNWWGPAGKTGPCGPDTEMFYWVGGLDKIPESFNDDNRLWIETWNDVFMQYNKTDDGNYEPLKQKNVDTGMGLERMAMIMQKKQSVYETDLFAPIMEKIDSLRSLASKLDEKAERIIADHIKASVFIITDGVEPSNVGRGYVLRRLIRRAVRHGKLLGIDKNFTKKIADVVIDIYKDVYPELLNNESRIINELEKEEENFKKTLEKGLRELEKMGDKVSGRDAFTLYSTYGFPLEMIKEIVKEVDENGFQEELKKHQELSKTASVGMFKGGLADASEQTTKYHTATHLLLAALRKVLSGHIEQKGSNITAERMRFDFSHPQKMTKEELEKVEDMINEKIKENSKIICEEMDIEEAKNKGAIGVFEHKYGSKVNVYSIDDFSKEICGGPHVKNTSELGKFKILKEEASSAGVRRIKAVLE